MIPGRLPSAIVDGILYEVAGRADLGLGLLVEGIDASTRPGQIWIDPRGKVRVVKGHTLLGTAPFTARVVAALNAASERDRGPSAAPLGAKAPTPLTAAVVLSYLDDATVVHAAREIAELLYQRSMGDYVPEPDVLYYVMSANPSMSVGGTALEAEVTRVARALVRLGLLCRKGRRLVLGADAEVPGELAAAVIAAEMREARRSEVMVRKTARTSAGLALLGLVGSRAEAVIERAYGHHGLVQSYLAGAERILLVEAEPERPPMPMFVVVFKNPDQGGWGSSWLREEAAPLADASWSAARWRNRGVEAKLVQAELVDPSIPRADPGHESNGNVEPGDYVPDDA
jgi:hypothetical protein